MNPSIAAFLGYVTWMLVLLGLLASVRVNLSVTGKKAPNSFDPSGADVSPFSNRLCRAHANCYESFPIFGGLLLLAIATDTTAVTDGLAYFLIGARVLQSVTHLASTSNLAVQVRFAFFVAQFLIGIYWVLQFINI
jgi:uncharacterized MAPEG superfamily protein